MSDYTPTTGEVRDSLVYLNKYHAKQYGDVDLLVVGSETAAQFDRMISEVERKAAEKALTKFADLLGVNAGDEDSEWWQGYRQGQRNALRMATKAAAAYRREETE